MDEHQDEIDRLHAAGTAPVDDELTSATLASMRAAGHSRRTRRTRVAIAAAALVGFFAGSFGLASAGALPADLQDRAQSVLDRVGVDVPPGHQRYNDPTVCPGGPYRNHGEYVRTHKDDPNAGASPCGKPVKSVNGTDESDSSDSEAPETPDASESESPGNGNGKGKQKDKTTADDGTTSSTASSAATTEPAPEATTTTTTTTAPTTTSEAPSATSAPSTASSP